MEKGGGEDVLELAYKRAGLGGQDQCLIEGVLTHRDHPGSLGGRVEDIAICLDTLTTISIVNVYSYSYSFEAFGSYSFWWVLQLQLRRSFWTWRVGCVAEYFCSDTLNIITIVNFYSHYILVNSFEEVFGLGGWLVSGEGDEGDFNITDHMPFVTDTCNNEQDNQGEKIGCSLRRVETPKAGSWDCVRTLLETTETQRAQCKQTPLSTMVWMGA